jgi:hypothetical protein
VKSPVSILPPCTVRRANSAEISTTFFLMAKDVLAIALGDVSGKGTAAALFASLAVGILREHVIQHPCPPVKQSVENRKRCGVGSGWAVC